MVRVHPCLPTFAHQARPKRELRLAGRAKVVHRSGVAAKVDHSSIKSMSQITVTLPDGSSREIAAGAPVRAVAEAISPGLAKAALAGVVVAGIVAVMAAGLPYQLGLVLGVIAGIAMAMIVDIAIDRKKQKDNR